MEARHSRAWWGAVNLAAPASPMAGTVKVVRFNWPKYLAVLVILVTAAAASTARAPEIVSGPLWAIGICGGVWTATSLLATWWVYDHRRVYEHLATGLAEAGQWATVHAGFDDASRALGKSIGHPPVAEVEIMVQPGPSLRRARHLGRRPPTSHPVDELPLATTCLDSIFLTFAAHEIRDLDSQRGLFRELHRALRPGGRLVITEHARDLANFAVYGPGAFHFQPLATWVTRAAEAGLSPESDAAITPFVHRLVCRR
jgi:SAM-dependent methyltransferase